MSLYGQFDYLDILSRNSRLVPPRDDGQDDDDDATADAGVVVSAHEEDDDDEDYSVLDDAAATTVAESSLDDTTLPSEIHVSSCDTASSGDDDGGALTILPSLPSREVARMQSEQQQQLQALSMQVQGAGPRTTRNAHSTISLSTTESHFTDVVPDGLSSVSSLSLSVSTLPSSGFTEEIVFVEDEAEDESLKTNRSIHSDGSNDESTLVKDVPAPSACARPSLLTRLFGNHQESTNDNNNKGPWYANLQTEQDWEAFREECLVLMEAMGDEAPKNADEMIAHLIANEEELLYKNKKKQQASTTILGLSYETFTMLAGAALVPLVGMALMARHRRAERAI